MPVAAHTVQSGPRAVELLVLAVEERVHGRISLNDDIAAFAPIASVGAALWDKCLTPETHTASAALSGYNLDACFIYEFHGGA
jgi:hypothetical protein